MIFVIVEQEKKKKNFKEEKKKREREKRGENHPLAKESTKEIDNPKINQASKSRSKLL